MLGCNIGRLFVNVLVYADDILAPSWHALQELIKILEYSCIKLNIVGNTKKTVCMIFRPRNKEKWISDSFPDFTFNGCKLQFVSKFRYLGYIISDDLSDDDDIRREIKNLFVRTNIVIYHHHHSRNRKW